MVETERAGHAREVVLSLSLAELQSYDGIVAVRHTPAPCGLHRNVMGSTMFRAAPLHACSKTHYSSAP